MRWCDKNGFGFGALLYAEGDIQALTVHRDGYQTAARRGQYLPRQPIPRFFYPRGTSIVKQCARSNLQSLLRARDNHDLLGIATNRPRGSEIGTDGFAKLFKTHRSTVVHFPCMGTSAMPHNQAGPRLEWKLVDCWLACVEGPQTTQPGEPFVRSKQHRTFRRSPRTGTNRG